MTVHKFSDFVNSAVVFAPGDIVDFDQGGSASDFRFTQDLNGVLVSSGWGSLTLLGGSLGGVSSSNFIFNDGSLALFEGDGPSLSGGSANDYLDVRQVADVAADAGGGDDIIYAGSALTQGDAIAGGAGNDKLILTGSYDAPVEFNAATVSGIETIVVERDSSVSLVLADETVTSAQGGRLEVDGTALSEQDVLVVDGSAVSGGPLTLTGGSGQDILTGGSGADTLSGGDGSDVLNGGGGNDTIVGGLGGDILTGGEGDDRFVIGFASPRGESSSAEESLFDHITDFEGAGSAGGDLLDLPSFWEGLPLVFAGEWDFNWSNDGSNGIQMNPDWVGDGMIDVIWHRAGSNVEIWLDANDDGQFSEGDLFIVLENVSELDEDDFADNFVAWRGTVGDDSVSFDGRNDLAYGLDGNDILSGGDGADRIYGGSGNDTLDGDAGGDRLDGGDGDDVLNGGDGNDWLIGERGNDTLNGGNDADTLYAAYFESDDVDSINTLNGGAGNDYLYGNEGRDTLNGGADDDALNGGGNDDILNGNDGTDTLYGDEGDDVLDGGAGDDVLNGGNGQDTLTGGSEADRFEFSVWEGDTSFAAPDTITDFNSGEGDKLSLLPGSSKPLLFRGELPAGFNLETGAPLTGSDDIGHGFRQVWWTRTATGIALIIDSNDDFELSGADFVIHLDGLSALQASDFVGGTFTVLTGTTGDDTNAELSGLVTSDADIIYGLDGNDILSGGDGADRIYGGSGNDTLDGDAGGDRLDGGDGDDVLNGGDGNDWLIGERGNDTLNGGNDADTLYAAYFESDDVDSINTLNGGAGNDYLYGNEGRDTLNGGADDDALNGGGNDDILNGNDGTDTLYGDEGDDVLDGGAGDDVLNGGNGQDTLTGGSEADRFEFSVWEGDTSFAAPDTITDFNSGEGDKLSLLPGSSKPLLFRGELPAGFNLETGAPLTGSDDIGHGFRQVWWTRTATGIALIIDSNDDFELSGADFVIHLDGLSALQASDFVDGTFTVLTGTTGDDTNAELSGLVTSDADIIYGLDGNDILSGGDGADRIYGGSGNDTLDGDAGGDRLDGGDGDDVLNGGDGNDWLIGERGNDTLNGGNDADTLYAAYFESDDVDSINTLNGGAGNDYLYGNEGRDTLNGGADDDALNGGGNDDILNGNDGTDTLYGDEGDDVLDGGAGDDVLNGGNGQDTLTGGSEADRFEFSVWEGDTSFAAPDTITDFNSGEGDKLSLLPGSSKPLLFRGELPAGFNLETGAPLTGSDDIGHGFRQVWWTRTATGIALIIDSNDDFELSGADFVIHLDGLSALQASDFVDGTFTVLTGTTGDDTNAELSGLVTSDADIIYGLDGNDILSGGDGADRIYGGSGNDTLDGDAGGDRLDGGDGDDVLNGGDGNDWLIGERGNDTLNGGNDADTLYAAYFESDDVDSINTLNGGAGNDYLYGNEGRDTLNGGADDDALNGGGNDDILNGNDGTDTLYGDEGDDVLDGGSLADQMFGGNGDDTYYVDVAGDTVVEYDNQGIDTVRTNLSYTLGSNVENLILGGSSNVNGTGNGLNNEITGNGAANKLNGGAGNDKLNGGNGADELAGGTGADTLIGGQGTDVAIYAGDRSSYVVSSLSDGTYKVVDQRSGNGNEGTDTVSGVEILRFANGSFAIGDLVQDLAPVSVSLSNSSVVENALGGTIVGTFSATDPEGMALTYSLTDSAGGIFKLSGNKLVTTKALDYETLKSDTVTVAVFDGVNTTTKTFTIGITDLNEAPATVALSNASVAENAAAGTTVGTFSATDPEGKTLSYTLTDTAGGIFKLSGNKLVTTKALDYETLKSDTVSVAVSDGVNTTTKTFTIGITDLNEAPATVALSNASVAENAAAGTTIGTFSATDPEGKTLSYTLTDTAGGIFKLSGNKLVTTKALDYETLKSDTVSVAVSDGVNTTTKVFTIGVLDINEAPISVTLSNAKVAENAVAGTVVGAFSATDPEGKALTYSLTDTAGGIFKLSGNKLVTTKALDYETLKTDTVTVAVSDGTNTTKQTFTIGVTNVNEAPSFLTLSASTVAENQKVGTTVGTFAAVDPEGGKLTYKLLDSAAGLFKLDGNKLLTAKTIDYEKIQKDTVQIEISDGTNKVTKVFAISVVDVAETIKGSNKSETITGGIGADTIDALDGDDKLYGGSGNDVLKGGLGKDFLVGGAGRDSFVFNTKLGSANIDTINDFSVKDDSIWLSDDVFTNVGKVGDLKPDAFYIGAKAHDASDRVIYDKASGKLWYDADGNGKGAAIQFAQIDKGLLLTAAHFDVLA